MNILDVINLWVQIEAGEKALVMEADSAKVGEELRADIPGAEKVNALLVKGHNGRRIRITAIVGTVEK